MTLATFDPTATPPQQDETGEASVDTVIRITGLLGTPHVQAIRGLADAVVEALGSGLGPAAAAAWERHLALVILWAVVTNYGEFTPDNALLASL